jgi:hypothetical protein
MQVDFFHAQHAIRSRLFLRVCTLAFLLWMIMTCSQQSPKMINPSSESDWFANPSRESSYTSLRTVSTNPPRTPTSTFRPRQSSNLSFNNSTWSSRHDQHWSNAGEPATPTSQFFGVGHGHGRHGHDLGHRGSNEKLDMDHVRMLWPEESTGC